MFASILLKLQTDREGQKEKLSFKTKLFQF